MATGSYERLTRGRAGTAIKTLLRRTAPATNARLQRAIRAGRRAWREPAAAALTPDQLLWNPRRRNHDWPTVAGEVTEKLFRVRSR